MTIASVLFGILLVANPGAGALTVLWLTGTSAVALGVIPIILALEARRFATRVAGAVAAS